MDDIVELTHKVATDFGEYLVTKMGVLFKHERNRLALLGLFARLVHKNAVSDEEVLGYVNNRVVHGLITDAFILGMLASEKPMVFEDMMETFTKMRSLAKAAVESGEVKLK